jgi:hypothetical protein
MWYDLLVSLILTSLDHHTFQYFTRGCYEPITVTEIILPPRLPKKRRPLSVSSPSVSIMRIPCTYRRKENRKIVSMISHIITNPNPRIRTSHFVSRGEQICRITVETLFEMPFPNCRPSWLISN